MTGHPTPKDIDELGQEYRDNWLNSSEEEKRQMSPLYDKVQTYVQRHNAIVNKLIDEVKYQLGAQESGSAQASKLVETLRREADARNHPDNIKESINSLLTQVKP